MKRLGAAGYAALLLAGTALPVFAAELPWTSTRVRGTVIYLAGDKWEEVARGQNLTSASVRTLRSGRVSIEAGGLTLELGPSSVLELGSSSQQANTQLRHYVGTITITSTGGTAETVSLQSGRLAVISIEGEVEVTVDDEATRLSVHKGTVSVRAPGGTIASLHTGEYVASDSGMIVAPQAVAAASGKNGALMGAGSLADATPVQSAGTAGSSVSDASGTGSGGSNSASGNGNANGGGNGNTGGSNGAASSGNANAGSGNSNAGGNGNGNANGAANGNGPGANSAGGNGSGKANGATSGNGIVDPQSSEAIEAP